MVLSEISWDTVTVMVTVTVTFVVTVTVMVTVMVIVMFRVSDRGRGTPEILHVRAIGQTDLNMARGMNMASGGDRGRG